MQDGCDWPVSFLGSIYAGLVPVAVNTLLTADDYAYMLENSRAQAVLVSGALLPTLSAALTRCDHEVRQVIVSRPQAPLKAPQKAAPSVDAQPQPGEVEFEAFVAAHDPAPPRRPPARMIRPSGSIHRARPAAPRARCTRRPTRTGRPSCMASGC